MITHQFGVFLSPLLHLSHIIDPHPYSFYVCVSEADPEGVLREMPSCFHQFNGVAHKCLWKEKRNLKTKKKMLFILEGVGR